MAGLSTQQFVIACVSLSGAIAAVLHVSTWCPSCCAPRAPLEKMSTQRHMHQAQELRKEYRAQRASRGLGPIAWARLASQCGLATSSRSQTVRKTVHFIRHGQAVHNALSALPDAQPCTCKRSSPEGLDCPSPECPYNASAAADSKLTQTGQQQAMALAPTLAQLVTSCLVVSSPLQRALETALLATASIKRSAPILALEDIREQYGMHRCDWRRDSSAITRQFETQVSITEVGPDRLWTSQRESKISVIERVEKFLRWLSNRPETDIVVVSHHHWLMALFAIVLECEEAELTRPFTTAELRSVQLEMRQEIQAA